MNAAVPVPKRPDGDAGRFPDVTTGIYNFSEQSGVMSEAESTEPGAEVKEAAHVDLYDAEKDRNELVTEFHAGILDIKQEALTLRQRAIESSALNSFAARSELGGMESDLAELHADVRSAYQALLTGEYGEFSRISNPPAAETRAAIEEHQSEIRAELDTVSAEVIQTRSAISDQKVTQMLTSALILGLVILLLTAGILLVSVV